MYFLYKKYILEEIEESETFGESKMFKLVVGKKERKKKHSKCLFKTKLTNFRFSTLIKK